MDIYIGLNSVGSVGFRFGFINSTRPYPGFGADGSETDWANQNSKPDPTDRAKIVFGSGLGRVGFLGLGSGQN
jgi:hypothetical protein